MAKASDTKSNKVLLTAAGFEKLKAELEHLKTQGRRDVAARLKEAISYGDLSENAEYDEAKNQQAFIEGRILELEEQIKNVEIISDSDIKEGVIRAGSTVTLQREGEDETHEYTIVGSTESDPTQHKISNESPVGEGIIGKKEGVTVTIEAPVGKVKYKILKVK
jgi:transcription elongation factor GreA